MGCFHMVSRIFLDLTGRTLLIPLSYLRQCYQGTNGYLQKEHSGMATSHELRKKTIVGHGISTLDFRRKRRQNCVVPSQSHEQSLDHIRTPLTQSAHPKVHPSASPKRRASAASESFHHHSIVIPNHSIFAQLLPSINAMSTGANQSTRSLIRWPSCCHNGPRTPRRPKEWHTIVKYFPSCVTMQQPQQRLSWGYAATANVEVILLNLFECFGILEYNGRSGYSHLINMIY